MAITILDPTDESVAVRRELAPRARSSLAGAVIGLMDIRKARGDVLLDELERLLLAEFEGATVIRYAKPTFTKPCPAELLDRIARECDVAVEALAD